MTRRTKIVATVGPASNSPEMLRKVIGAGVDVVRLNLSHGDIDDHVALVGEVRAAADDVGRAVAVLADLPGPKIRSGRFPEGGVTLEIGHRLVLVPGDGPSGLDQITVDYDTLLDDLTPDAVVMLGDGVISMRVVEVDGTQATAEILTGGRASGSPGVHLPSDAIRLTTPTEEDLVLAERMSEADVEFIAVSFVREAIDVQRVRDVVDGRAQLVAKIETAASVRHLDEIIDASDAVMVARGDLGIDCPIEDVPHLQKQIIRGCVEAGVPVITATQMLESMINSPSPTRAEISDVANAVFDGTDAVMLSGETAIGRDPVGVVETMASVAERAEEEGGYRQWATRLGPEHVRGSTEGERTSVKIARALSHAAWQAAIDADAAAILCCTRSGRTARAMARFRPSATLVGLSPDPKMVRTMALTWGVAPVEVDMYESTDQLVWFAIETAVRRELIDHGDTVLVLAGAPNQTTDGGGVSVATDVLRLVQVA